MGMPMNQTQISALAKIHVALNPHGLRIHGSGIHRRIRVVLRAEGLIEEDPVYETIRLTPKGREALASHEPAL